MHIYTSLEILWVQQNSNGFTNVQRCKKPGSLENDTHFIELLTALSISRLNGRRISSQTMTIQTAFLHAYYKSP